MKSKNGYEMIMKKTESSKSKYAEKVQELMEASCSITEGFQDLEIDTNVGIQCNLGADETEELKQKLQMLDSELRERNKELYKLREENNRI